MKTILTCIIFISVLFIFQGCDDINDPVYWEKIGELDLKGSKLVITIPKKDNFKKKLIRFYFAEREEKLFKSPEAYEIVFYDSSLLLINKDKSKGSYEEEVYGSTKINQDPFNFYLEIPNKFFSQEGMKLWSAYEKNVFVKGIKLYSKKTGKIDKRDPYPYIFITNTIRRENIR